MDFLAQEVFYSARRQQQDQLLCVLYIQIWCPMHFILLSATHRLCIQNVALPSIWQQPNQRGEEDEEAHTREGKSYPDGDTEVEMTWGSLTASNTITQLNVMCCNITTGAFKKVQCYFCLIWFQFQCLCSRTISFFNTKYWKKHYSTTFFCLFNRWLKSGFSSDKVGCIFIL